MARPWEIRGLFGNEYAMGRAVEELERHQGFDYVVLDRRNLSVRFARRDKRTEDIVKRTFEIHHGFVESEAPLGVFEATKEEEKRTKAKRLEEKQRRASH